ncbi:MAG: SsrA-binding protein SmpB [Actinobacteria bacterium]|nr:MAG: SsrA-binding protein SmpB [Actinomycetota bacterium]
MKTKIVAKNRKAFHDYHIEEKIEAGIVLTGTEVKSVRQGNITIKDSYAGLDKEEVYLYNMHISPFKAGDIRAYDPERTRKLLLHKGEIKRLIGKIQEKGLTLLPLSIYFSNRVAKVELGLAKGKKLYDKRKALAEKTAKREIEREIKNRGVGSRK